MDKGKREEGVKCRMDTHTQRERERERERLKIGKNTCTHMLIEQLIEKREEGYKGQHSGLTIAGLTITQTHLLDLHPHLQG